MKEISSFTYETVQGYKFGSLPIGKPYLSVYIYYVDGLLIDTGHSNMSKEILNTVSGLPVEQMFITHHHEDHSGNIIPFQKHFACPAYAPSKTCELMQQSYSTNPAQLFTWGRFIPTDRLLPEDQAIETANHHFDLIHLTGHAEDMAVLLDKERGWLFSADLYINDYIKFIHRSEKIGEQIVSLKKALTLDFEVMFCQHNPVLTNPKEKLRSKLQFLEDFYGQVRKLHYEGYSDKAILKALGLKEAKKVKLMSLGHNSRINMVKSVVRSL